MEFANEEPLQQLLVDLEKSYANSFTYGFKGLAHLELSPPEVNIWDYCRTTFHVGMCFPLLLWLIWDCMFSPSAGINIFGHPIVSLYIACGGFILMIWFWGLNLVVWGQAKIDYISLLGFDVAITYTPTEVFTEVSVASIFYLVNMLIYYKMLRDPGGEYTHISTHWCANEWMGRI